MFVPEHAARANGVLIALGCAFNVLAPLFGVLSDRYGSRRPLMLAGALAMMGAIAGMLAAVSGLLGGRSTAAFVLYCACYVLMNVGWTCLSVSFSGVLADYGKLMPAKLGTLSGIWSLFKIIGATLGFLLAGIVLPVKADSHAFYYVLAVMMAVANLGLMRMPNVLLRTKTTAATSATPPAATAGSLAPAAPASSSTCSSNLRQVRHMLSAWLCASEYAGFRLVFLGRLMFYCGLGTFAATTLFFFEDQTDAKSNASRYYTYVALISLATSLASVFPTGLLSDKFGMGPVAVVGGGLMAVMLAVMSFLSTTTAIMCIVPLYGLGQQFYNVGDLGLVVQSVPRDDTRARDMGAWSAGEAMGQALGSAFAGFAISFFHEALPAPDTAAPLSPSPASASASASDAGKRLPYSRLGYQVVYLAGSAAMVLSCFVVQLAVRRVAAAAHQLQDASSAATEDEDRGFEGQEAGKMAVALTHFNE